MRSTPGRLRIAALVSVVVVVIVGTLAWILTTELVNRTDEIAYTNGVVLITNQQIKASLAEADAAAAAVHLAGASGDRLQRRSYERALQRASDGVETVAASLGDNPDAHENLQTISSSITTYAATVEGARVASVNEIDSANDQLTDAISLLRDDIGSDIDELTTSAESSFNSDTKAPWYYVAIAAVFVLLVAAIGVQFWMYKRFRRILNIPLVVATVVLVALLVWLNVSFDRQQRALNDARDGAYEAIGLTESIQRDAFAYRADETAAVFDLTGADSDELDSLRASVTATIDEALEEADSEREAAAVSEVAARWERYLATSDRLGLAVDANDLNAARALVRGDSTDAFAGFNTAVEGALYDNRTQFVAAVDDALGALAYLRWIIVFATLAAAGLIWWGYGQRIAEYQ